MPAKVNEAGARGGGEGQLSASATPLARRRYPGAAPAPQGLSLWGPCAAVAFQAPASTLLHQDQEGATAQPKTEMARLPLGTSLGVKSSGCGVRK